MYTGLTAAICIEAWEICRPTLERAYDMGTTNKFAGTLVVLKPRSDELQFVSTINDDGGPKATMYREIALAKARVSYETGLPSRVVQQEAPHLYQEGMTKWGGSATENGLVVAFSGVQAVFDEAISWMVLNWIVALCRHEMTREGGVMDSEGSFLTQAVPPPDYAIQYGEQTPD